MNMPSNKKTKGIFLITTMLILTIIIMIALLVTNSACNGLKLGNAYSEKEQAYYAAVSGIEYARARLYRDSGWMQFRKEIPNTSANIGSTEPVKVYEENGIVTGYIGGDAKNYRSKFTIAFLDIREYEKNGKDYLTALSQKIPTGLTYVSCNNLFNLSQSETVRLDKNKNFEKYKTVPENSIYIVVQGVANNSTQYAEAFIETTDIKDLGASSIARGDIEVSLKGSNSTFLVDTKSEDPPAIRSLENIAVSSTSGGKNCFVLKNNGTAYASAIKVNDKLLSADNVGKYGINIDTDVEKTKTMLSSGNSLTWDSLSSENSENLPGGAYIYDCSNNKWLFFDKQNITLSESDVILRGNPSSPSTDGRYTFKPVEGTGTNPQLLINGEVKASSNLVVAVVDSLDSLPPLEDGKRLNTDSISQNKRAELFFSGSWPSLEVGPAKSTADTESSSLIVYGELTGQGKVYAKGDISFQGGSFFDTEKNSGVSVYAEENVRIIPATGTALSELDAACLQYWQAFYNTQTSSPYTKMKDAVDGLLETKIDGKDFSDVLYELGCKKSKDQKQFAETFIAQNSAFFGGGRDNGQGESTEQTFETVVPAPGLFYDPTGLDAYDPYCNLPAKVIDLGDNTTMSIQKIKNNINYLDTDATGVALKESPSANFLQLWIHDKGEGSGESPNDLFIYINTSSTAENGIANFKIFTRFGVGKYFPGRGKNYAQETFKNISFGSESDFLTTNSDGSVSLNISSILNKLKPDDTNIYTKKYDSNYELETVESNKNNLKKVWNNIIEKLDEKGVADLSVVETDRSHDLSISSTFNSAQQPDSITVSREDPNRLICSCTNTKAHMHLNQFPDKTNTTPNSNDTIVRGMIFTRNGNFSVNIPNGSLTVRGGIISYGERKKNNSATDGGGIDVKAKSFNLCYDPDYMQFFYGRGVITRYLYRGTFS